MTYNEYLQLCLDAALDIKARNFDNRFGICGNMEDKVINAIEVKFPEYAFANGENFMNLWRILREAFYTWPKFSGDVNFPINDPYNKVSAHRAYNDLPKWVGEYGALRFELLDHVIDYLKKEIKNVACN